MSNTKEKGVPTFDKALPDEPVFVLRAQDMLAPEIVREWAYRARKEGVDPEKVDAARRVADQMEDWQINNTKKKPD